ncbi:TonB-dependent receptor [Parashewanella curva]|uniref:TonB-dependent receptor n=2 Tax=Parashewanella curva TaxID=2338552 RepID=A0A3L8Q2P9_9GAMM|nr:TonB-dependent receptor [Parashewanella curva]RLV61183.1 TonB-dependent receptor [Parashewanella curva]
MKKPTKLSMLTLSLIAAGMTNVAVAAGKFEGNIRDINSQQPLAGAIVSIKELNQTQTAGRDGRFFFNGLKAGTYTVTITYLGAAPQTKTIQVKDNRTTSLNIKLTSGEIERIQVIGQSGSLSKSLNRQRSADNLLSVISSDVLGNFPDSNVSEALQRVPGISIERDQGEGRFVRVRGLAPDFNSVSMNGTRLPAPEDDRRAVALDVIPSDLVQSVEVSKTVTPDMDADALGGAVEVKSLSAFDRDGRFYNVSTEASYNQLRDKASPKIAFSFSDVINDKFGFAIAASWYKRKFGSDNVETGGKWDFPEDTGYDNAVLEEIEARSYDITRERLGIGANFDYRPNDNNDLYLRTLYSQFDDVESRYGSEVSWEVGDDEEGLPLGQRHEAEVKRSLKSRTEEQNITSYALGGKSRLTKWTIDYQVAYSEASAAKPRHIDGADFEADIDNMGYSETKISRLIGPAAYYDTGEYELKEIEVADSKTTDEMTSAKLNFSRSFELGSNSGGIKFGFKTSSRDKTNREDIWKFEDLDESGINEDALNMSKFADESINYRLGQFGPRINAAPVWDLVNKLNPDDFKDEVESVINDFDIKEKINAGYLMGHMDFDQLRLLAGVRYESMDRYSTGVEFKEDETYSSSSFNKDEDHWLPALHAKYNINDSTIVRAAWTNTITRPTFDQIAPGYFVEDDDGDIKAEFGNPNLESLESVNFDLSIEHYFDGIGLLSAGFFYKDIENFIYQTDLAGQKGRFEKFDEAVTFANGVDAEIKGLELVYVQEFNFLPEPFSDMILNTNVTYTDSEATIDWFDDGERMERVIPLPSQSDLTANFSLGYENAYTSVWLSAAYKSEYLQEVSDFEDARYDLYEDSHLQWDFVAKAHVTEQVTVYFKAINITDEPFYSYTGSRRFNNQYEAYGRTFQLGVQMVSF